MRMIILIALAVAVAGCATRDLSGRVVSTSETVLSSNGGTANSDGVAAMTFQSGTLANDTTIRIYPDSSATMRDVFTAGADLFQFEFVDRQAVVVGLSSAPSSTENKIGIQISISEELAAAFTAGATPTLLYFAGQTRDPDENDADFGEFIPIDGAQFDPATRSVLANVPVEVFSLDSRIAIFFAAGTRLAEAISEPPNVATVGARKSASANPFAPTSFANPLGSEQLVIQGGFGEWRDLQKRPHFGLDFLTVAAGNAAELPIVAVEDGKIFAVTLNTCLPAAAGKTIKIVCKAENPMLSVNLRLKSGINVAYRHLKYGSVTKSLTRLSPDSRCVKAIAGSDSYPPTRRFVDNDADNPCTVSRGDVLGCSSGTGADNKHLHFEALTKVTSSNLVGTKLNPIAFLTNVRLERLDSSLTHAMEVPLSRVSAPVPSSFTGPTFRTPEVGVQATGEPDDALPLRISIRDQNDQEILIRRRPPSTHLPVTADWAQRIPKSESVVVAIKNSGPPIAFVTPGPLRPDPVRQISHNNGVQLVDPIYEGKGEEKEICSDLVYGGVEAGD
ncbi:hypothetical protein [Paraburkholderia hospita]|uniref:hypothetical protein n=1 Tax=Paraburkholderia hospita TaxID=169430 RepID=UPI000B34241E|nr:hypothetical protein [Paraburkholderia hospita]OUL79610.1 hypothetical protein CA603_33260 [Paraburkholderia hospita]